MTASDQATRDKTLAGRGPSTHDALPNSDDCEPTAQPICLGNGPGRCETFEVWDRKLQPGPLRRVIGDLSDRARVLASLGIGSPSLSLV